MYMLTRALCSRILSLELSAVETEGHKKGTGGEG